MSSSIRVLPVASYAWPNEMHVPSVWRYQMATMLEIVTSEVGCINYLPKQQSAYRVPHLTIARSVDQDARIQRQELADLLYNIRVGMIIVIITTQGTNK